MKFDPVGFHPIEHRPLNVIEQINQTWTYAVAFAAAKQLFILHPDSGPLLVAPGAHMALTLDIMSEREGYIGAETFAAVSPANNKKLNKDLDKLAVRPERYRYVFFMSPSFPCAQRVSKFERGGVQVWSVDFSREETATRSEALPVKEGEVDEAVPDRIIDIDKLTEAAIAAYRNSEQAKSRASPADSNARVRQKQAANQLALDAVAQGSASTLITLGALAGALTPRRGRRN